MQRSGALLLSVALTVIVAVARLEGIAVDSRIPIGISTFPAARGDGNGRFCQAGRDRSREQDIKGNIDGACSNGTRQAIPCNRSCSQRQTECLRGADAASPVLLDDAGIHLDLESSCSYGLFSRSGAPM